MTNTTTKETFHGGDCYACDHKAVGLRDRRPEGFDLEPACQRHADPTIHVSRCCMYCDRPVRHGSLEVDGNFAHVSCHREASS